jgi:hypothetical protein
MECVLRWFDELDSSLFAAALLWHSHSGLALRRRTALGLLTLALLLAPAW